MIVLRVVKKTVENQKILRGRKKPGASQHSFAQLKDP